MLQTKNGKEGIESYISRYIINDKVEWLIECGKVHEAVYFRGQIGDRYTTYVVTKRNKSTVDFHSVYHSYGYGTSSSEYIASIRNYIFTMAASGDNQWSGGCGYSLKQLMRQGVMSKKHPHKIRYCRSAYMMKTHDDNEFNPWDGMKLDLKTGVLVNKPNRKSIKRYRTAKDTDRKQRKANYIANKNNTKALARYRAAGGDTEQARRWNAQTGAGTANINWDMIPIDDVFKHRNATLRSNIIEHYGMNKILETLKHDVIDIDFIDGCEYKLLNVVIPDYSQGQLEETTGLYLQMVNPSTGEDHFEGVANTGTWQGMDEATVKGALSWRDGDNIIQSSISKDDRIEGYIKPIILT